MSDESALLLVAAVPLIIGWFYAVGEVLWRPDLSILRKVVWVAALWVFSVFTLAVYIVVRPRRSESLLANAPTSGTRRAGELVLLAEANARGDVDDRTYRDRLDAILDVDHPD